MNCPTCGHPDSQVKDSRKKHDYIMRVREFGCGHVIETVEIVKGKAISINQSRMAVGAFHQMDEAYIKLKKVAERLGLINV